MDTFKFKVRDDFLNMEIFYNVAEAQVKDGIWRLEYNGIRLHCSLRYQIPEECRQGYFSVLNSVTLQSPLPT